MNNNWYMILNTKTGESHTRAFTPAQLTECIRDGFDVIIHIKGEKQINFLMEGKQMANKRMYTYIIGLGFEGCIFERHEVKAANESDAYYMGVRMLDPKKGYNYITTKRIYKKEGIAHEKR